MPRSLQLDSNGVASDTCMPHVQGFLMYVHLVGHGTRSGLHDLVHRPGAVGSTLSGPKRRAAGLLLVLGLVSCPLRR